MRRILARLTALLLFPALFAGTARADVVLVNNYFNNSVERFDPTTGANLGTFISNNPALNGGLSEPAGIVYNPTDQLIYVSSQGTNQILRYNLNGSFHDVFANLSSVNAQYGPAGLRFNPVNGDLYVARNLNFFFNSGSAGQGTVDRLSKINGAFVGSVMTGMTGPTSVMFNSNGDLFGASFQSTTAQSPDGLGYINKVPNGGSQSFFVAPETTTLLTPAGMAFVPNTSKLAVVDLSGGAIRQFSSTGSQLPDLIAANGALNGQFPSDVVFGANNPNILWVANLGSNDPPNPPNGSVMLFNLAGPTPQTPIMTTSGFFAAEFAPAPVALVFTWTGTVSGSWNNASNWSPAGVPVSSAENQFVFGSTSNAAMTNDIPGTMVLNSMTFNAGSPVYSLTGNGLNFQTSSNGTQPQIVQNSFNSVALNVPVTLTNNLTVSGSGNLTLGGAVGGAGSLTMAGSGTLTLSGANAYGGGTVVQNGTVSVNADAALGTGNVTGASLGTLAFTGTTTTTKSFAMGGGTITVAAGKTVTFDGGQVSNVFLDGAGTLATSATNGARFVGVTTTASVAVTLNSAADVFRNVTNSGALTVAPGINTAGTSTNVTFNSFTNQGLGSVTVGANSQVNAASFQSFGTLTLNPGSGANPTQLTNLGASPLGFNGGSRTFISIPAHAGSFDAGIDLHGQNVIVAGGLFVNNGYVVDSVGAGTKTVIADFGSLVKGAGFYQNSVQTVNGGKFQSGNSPGQASFGSFTFGPGGVSNYVFDINNALGTAGPRPDANGQVSGWGLVKAVQQSTNTGTTTGNFAWTATAADKLNVSLDTLINPTTSGTEPTGVMANFDPSKPYSWLAASWAGSYSGPTDPAALNAATAFDSSGFQNPVAGGFGWSFGPDGHSLSLTYTPGAVPEPGTLLLVGGAAAALLVRRKKKN
jgi:autotransporter-associated beta strand protein